MHPPTHALLSWLVAESAPVDRRDRFLILLSGVVPDLDGLTLMGGVELYQTWHHVVLHNALAAVCYASAAAWLAGRRPLIFGLTLIGYHLHLLCDLLGSAGPDGSLWAIPYLAPFDLREFSFHRQWGLASWQNVLITALALAACAHLGAARGRTIVEVVSHKADAEVVAVLRRRWPWSRPAR